MVNVANTLAAARARAGLTQTELAQRAGTSQATVSAYESGRKQPTVDTFGRILAATGARLTVHPRAKAVALPSPAQQRYAADTLVAVIELAAALPTRHDGELRYPPLRGPSPRSRA